MNWILYALKTGCDRSRRLPRLAGLVVDQGLFHGMFGVLKCKLDLLHLGYIWKIFIHLSNKFAHGKTAKLSCNVQNFGSNGSILSHDFIRFVTWIYKYLVMRHPCDCSMLNIIATEFVYNGMKILNIRRMSRQMIHVVRDSEKKATSWLQRNR